MEKNNSAAIIVFCSHICVSRDVKPLEPREWSQLAEYLLSNNINPFELLDYRKNDFMNKLLVTSDFAERLEKLVRRSGSIAFELEKMDKMGIKIVTRADSTYPQLLKRVLGKSCPPIFYAAGDLNLVNKKLIGFVGSRSVSDLDFEITKKLVDNVVKNNYGVVSGGAKGIDSIAVEEVLKRGGVAVEYIADSMLRKIKRPAVMKHIREGNLLLLSITKPSAGFNAGIAMMRNKYIYANSIGTVVVKSDLDKGGTWAGATENLKNSYTNLYCWNNLNYAGNLELIKKGALPIDEDWDVNVKLKKVEDTKKNIQLSLFG